MKLRVLAERPPLPQGNEEDQVRALRDYLWRVSEELEYILTQLDSDIETNDKLIAANADAITANATSITTHVTNTDNPHQVTAEQLGAALATDIPEASDDNPVMDGTASPGTADTWSRSDHVHPTDTSLATAADLVSHLNNVSNPHTVTKTQVGLANVDNVQQYSASNKPPAENVTYDNTDSGLSATTAQAAIDELAGDIPTVPSAYTSNPAMDGTASPGSSGKWSRGDHVHPSDTSKADLADELITVAFSSFSSLPQTKSVAAITADHVVLEATLGTPASQTGDWTVTTSSGSVTVSGSISGSTTLTLRLGKIGTSA